MPSLTSKTKTRPSTRGSALAAMALMLLGCSHSLDKATIAAAIDKEMATEPRSRDCVVVAGPGQVTWPLKAVITSATQWPNPILEAMQKAGYLTLDTQKAGLASIVGASDNVLITPTPEAASWYDPQRGFCIGRFKTDTVTRFDAPGSGTGTPTDAEFTWRLADVPAWAQRAEFNAIPGLAADAPGSAHLEKTSDGWVATAVRI
jgi:hypothetical protein